MIRVFTNIPFFRILIPFVIGILFSLQFYPKPVNLLYFVFLIAAAVTLRFFKNQSTYLKRGFLICIDIFFFLLAFNLVHHTNVIEQKKYYGNYIQSDSSACLVVTINELPTQKEKFIKCRLRVNEVKTKTGYKKTEGTIFGYFKRSTSDQKLKAGSTFIIKTKLLAVSAPQNPYEFNYQNYLYNKHIYHTAFIDKDAYEVLNVPVQLNPIWYYGLLIKDHILQQLKNSKLSADAYGICAALLTGYDDEIDKQVVESFSHSGTLHVLSVSGLHTGLIYLVLSFLFDLIDKKRRYKLLKFIFITVLLWAFALITGFSAPVLRAVIMFNLLGFGKIFFRSDHRNQVNILLVSAFILLCYDPFFITDVGFLLSYFAVFGLLYFQPKLEANWQPENYLLKKFWQATTVSFAATIATLPLTLFFFKQFPLWFFICNILVVPASFVILLLSALIVFKMGFVAVLINYLVKGLIAFITFFNSAEYGFIDSIDFSFFDTIFLSFFIIVVTLSIQNRSYRLSVACLVLLIWWQLSALFLSFNSKTEDLLAVYQINKHHTLAVKNKQSTTLNALDSSNFMFHVKPHIISFNNTKLNVNEFNYVKKDDKQILILNKPNHWPDIPLAKISLLVLANNYRLSAKNLEAFSGLKTIVMDGSNNNFSIKKTEELCRKFDVELIKTKQRGAYILNL
ncbi:MAG: ComEC/Rec2 family competence protein [Bacteroidota bacterium]|nr:ComEC/Rec2 family competence protein [Bacteroidota bacterium]